MKIYSEWMTDSEYFGEDYPNNKLLDDATYRFEVQKQSLEGKDALVDGIAERIVAQNHTNPLNQQNYDKKLSFNIASDVRTGSLVEFDNIRWLVTSPIYDKQAYKVASVKKSIYTLSYYKNSILYKIPIVVESGVRLYSQGQKENKYFPTLENELIIYAPNNKNTESIREDNVFRIGKNNYKVMSVQDVLIDGLLVIKVETTTEEPESPPISPTPQEIVIVGLSSIIKGKTSEYTVNYSEPVIWSIDGDFASIVNYDDNSCIVKASSNLGNVRLWAKYGDVEGYKDIAIEGYF